MKKQLCSCLLALGFLLFCHVSNSNAAVYKLDAPPVVVNQVHIEAEPVVVSGIQERQISDSEVPLPEAQETPTIPSPNLEKLNWKETSYSDDPLPPLETLDSKDDKKSVPVKETENVDARTKAIDQELHRMAQEQAKATDSQAQIPSSVKSELEKLGVATDKEMQFENKTHPPRRMSEGDTRKPYIADQESIQRMQRGDKSEGPSIDKMEIITEPETELNIKENEWELGTEISHITYKEPVFNLKDTGLMYGLYGGYTYHFPKQSRFTDFFSMFRADAKISYGEIDYEVDGADPIDDISDYMFEARMVGGNDYYLGKRTMVTPYLGFGFRYLNDDTSGMTTRDTATGNTLYGYERQANYYYIPIGVESLHKFSGGWMVSPNFEYDLFIMGVQKSFLSDVPGGLGDIKNKQRQGFGLRGSVKLVKENNKVNLLAQPFIRYWHIQDSDVDFGFGENFISAGLEPENSSTEYGVKLGIQY